MPSDAFPLTRRARANTGRILIFAYALATWATGQPSGAVATQPAVGAEQSAWKLPVASRTAVEALGPVLIEAIRATTDEERQKLVRAAYDEREIARVGIEKIANQLGGVAARFPGLKFERAELTEWQMGDRVSRVLHVYAHQPGAKLWHDLQVYVSPSAPHHLLQLAFVAEVTEPVALPNGGLTDARTLTWLNEYVDRLAREHDLSGTVLIAVGERVIFERCFGYADAQRATPVTPQTLFNLASASKMFTALGIARLVTDGKLSYTDTIEKYFPEYPDGDFARHVTIGNLLSHSSGVAEYWTDQTGAAVRAARSTADLLPLVCRAGKAFEPGSQHAYSNSNFILAGLIIERVTNTPFEQFTAHLLFEPLGMVQTGYFDRRDTQRPIAQPLQRTGDGWTTHPQGALGTAAGGCLTTARDMLRFMRALLAGKIVPPSALAQMVASKVTPGVEADHDYGYGFLLQRNGQVTSYGHGGIAPGVNSEIRYFPARDVTLILLNNQDNGAYDDLRKNIIRLVTDER